MNLCDGQRRDAPAAARLRVRLRTWTPQPGRHCRLAEADHRRPDVPDFTTGAGPLYLSGGIARRIRASLSARRSSTTPGFGARIVVLAAGFAKTGDAQTDAKAIAAALAPSCRVGLLVRPRLADEERRGDRGDQRRDGHHRDRPRPVARPRPARASPAWTAPASHGLTAASRSSRTTQRPRRQGRSSPPRPRRRTSRRAQPRTPSWTTSPRDRARARERARRRAAPACPTSCGRSCSRSPVRSGDDRGRRRHRRRHRDPRSTAAPQRPSATAPSSSSTAAQAAWTTGTNGAIGAAWLVLDSFADGDAVAP